MTDAPTDTAVLSKLLFDAQEAYREARGWSPNGYGGET